MQGGLSIALVVLVLAAGCVGKPGADATPPAASATTPATPPAGAITNATPATNATLTARPAIALHVTLDGIYPVTTKFTLDKESIPSGAVVTVTFDNKDQNPLGNHDWTLEGVEGAQTKQIDTGKTAEARFVAPAPGTYEYICSVPGHKDHGMIGKLTIA